MPHKDFDKAIEYLNNASTILFTTHERTDGDDLGTVLALAQHLKSQGKKVFTSIRGGTPEQLKFLPGSSEVTELPPNTNFDLIVFSGCSKKERASIPEILTLKAPILNLDHHPDNSNFGDINVVDSKKSSVAELTYDLFQYANWKITNKIATCLLTGIFTDTGSFMHSNTKQETLRAAADLMKKGASVTKIAKFTYRGKNGNTLKAWSKALENTYYDPKKKIIYSVITDNDLNHLKNVPLSAFEGFVETLNKVPDAKVALFLKQDGDIIKGSLRSDPYKGINVQKIASVLGGGGHVWASGFSLVGKLEKDLKGKWAVVNTDTNISS